MHAAPDEAIGGQPPRARFPEKTSWFLTKRGPNADDLSALTLTSRAIMAAAVASANQRRSARRAAPECSPNAAAMRGSCRQTHRSGPGRSHRRGSPIPPNQSRWPLRPGSRHGTIGRVRPRRATERRAVGAKFAQKHVVGRNTVRLRPARNLRKIRRDGAAVKTRGTIVLQSRLRVLVGQCLLRAERSGCGDQRAAVAVNCRRAVGGAGGVRHGGQVARRIPRRALWVN